MSGTNKVLWPGMCLACPGLCYATKHTDFYNIYVLQLAMSTVTQVLIDQHGCWLFSGLWTSHIWGRM